MNVGEVVHWVCIKAYTKQGASGVEIDHLHWYAMSFEVRTKWNWYFNYRAALMQVHHPKAYIDYRWGHEEPKTEHDTVLLLKRQITSKKRKITEIKNKLEYAQQYYNGYMVQWKKQQENLLIKDEPPIPVIETKEFLFLKCKYERLIKELNQLETDNHE